MDLARLRASFVAAVRLDGLEPSPALRLLSGERPDVEAPPVPGPWELGTEYEGALPHATRSSTGAWYTPREVARELVTRALPVATDGVVSDPSCGGGAFLLAAAERLRDLGTEPGAAVERLSGTDTDPNAVAITEAALWWWSARAGQPVVAGTRLTVGDALVDAPPPRSVAIVGNPPFLSQLKRRTAVDSERRTRLRSVFGDAVRPYTDPAWLFLLLALERLEPGGRAVLVQPTSLLAARDAGSVRRTIEGRAEVEDIWVAPGKVFQAAVDVCAPTLVRRSGGGRTDWVGPLADSLGVPRVRVSADVPLESIATTKAGFRDEYYGLSESITEGGCGPRLVTSGEIDPFGRRRDGRPIRFDNRIWSDPVVDPSRATGRARAWVDAQSLPKVLVATQTRVIEAMADPDGSLVGSVPVIAVTPDDATDLWHLLAAVHAPATTAWLLRQCSGTALSADACKPTSTLLAALPLPVDVAAWDEAAEEARKLHHGAGSFAAFARAAGRAYCVGDEVASWWLGRLPRRVSDG